MSQIFLFTGENTYLLRRERERWIDEFRRKHGDENCLVADGQKISVRELWDDVSMLPFLAERRLVVVDTVPRCTREDIQTLARSIHPQVVLLFCDPKVDKRTSGAKELLDTAEVKQFAALKRPQLEQWLKTYASGKNAALSDDARGLLLEYLGEDMNLLAQEVDKLSLFAAGKGISKTDVEQQTIPSDEGIVWRMTDLMTQGKKSVAVSYAHRMLSRGGDAYGLWALLLSTLKNIVLVHAAVHSGITSSKDIAEKSGIHPFALRSLQPFASKIKREQLETFVAWAAQSDRDLKTGRIRATDEAPEEIRVLIDQFLLKCP
ncbi:MAG TPA: DNA polymerase III subunit delta [Candidatus Peribacteraceae bacterium]|nr:DNA polymerase III subunit delta [Candidatus Peribacteraceae bacterium]